MTNLSSQHLLEIDTVLFDVFGTVVGWRNDP